MLFIAQRECGTASIVVARVNNNIVGMHEDFGSGSLKERTCTVNVIGMPMRKQNSKLMFKLTVFQPPRISISKNVLI
jgi:hypothetical protein